MLTLPADSKFYVELREARQKKQEFGCNLGRRIGPGAAASATGALDAGAY